jgi:hypothetical protein
MTSRTWVDGNVIAYKPLDGTVVYVLGSNGILWRENGTMASRTPVLGGVASFDVGYALDGAESAYAIDPTNRLWRVHQGVTALVDSGVSGVQWVQAERGNGIYSPSDTPSSLVCLAPGQPTLFVLGTNGQLSHGAEDWGAAYAPARPVDANVASFTALNEATIFVKGSDSKLWDEYATYQVRRVVDPSAATFAPLDTKTVFVEDASSQLWREEYSSQNRDLVDVNVAAYQPVGDTSAYVLRKDGNLWLETLAPAACQYRYGSAAVQEPNPSLGLVEAWGTQTPSGSCPNVPGSGGTWTATPGTKLPVPATCGSLGLPATCCLYAWSPANPSDPALADSAALCSSNNRNLTAVLVNGVEEVSSGESNPCGHAVSPSSPPCPFCTPM